VHLLVNKLLKLWNLAYKSSIVVLNLSAIS
jgi:hypothetical protein